MISQGGIADRGRMIPYVCIPNDTPFRAGRAQRVRLRRDGASLCRGVSG